MSTAAMTLTRANIDNFFISMAAEQSYRGTQIGMDKDNGFGRKKVYNNMKKMLREGFLCGSLKYGTNFIV